MDISGEYRIPAPRQKVWEALNDPAVLRASIPGCEELEAVSPTEYAAKVKAKVGAVSARFGGKVTLSDIVAPESYTISGQGQGGVAGFAKGSARVTLTEDGAETILRYDAKADVGGKIAAVGSRLIQGVATKTADDFFTAFAAIVTGPKAEAAPVPEAAPAVPAAERPQAAPAKAERGAIFWLLLGIAIGSAATALGVLVR
jgi:carbon monoxide dehydrogenase subunit G